MSEELSVRRYRLLLLDQPAVQRMIKYAKTRRLAVRVDGISHEIIKLDGNTASVTLACEPTMGLLVDPGTLVYEYGEIDIDCMTCLVRAPDRYVGWYVCPLSV